MKVKSRLMSCGFLVLLCVGSVATAEVFQVQLPLAKIKRTSSKMAQVRISEDQEKWADCAKLAPAAVQEEPQMKGWILITWLKCARKADGKSGANVVTASRAALASLAASPLLLHQGPWSKMLAGENLKTRIQIVQAQASAFSVKSEKDILDLLEAIEPSDKDNRARALAYLGDWSTSQRDAEAARTFYEESLDLKEVKSVREKYMQVLLILNKKKELKPAESRDEFLSETERKFQERFDNAQKNNDLLALLDDCVTYLNQFPHGKSSKWASEKVLEIYLTFFDQSRSGEEKWQALLGKALSLIEKGEWSRLGEWARIIHKRGDFQGSLRLAEKALDRTGVSAWGGPLLYVAGRSAQIAGDQRRAQKFFESYLVQESSGDDVQEVLFRLGLVHLRQGQNASAVAVFERLLSIRNQEKYELPARYWMIRALQTGQSPRAQVEIDSLLQKYPFSFYGLKLRAEQKNGALEWPSNPAESKEDLKGQLKLSAVQKKSWDRIMILGRAGWKSEALAEVQGFPAPDDSVLKVLLAQVWNDVQAFPAVVKLVNQAGDQTPELRSQKWMMLGFPREYKSAVEAEAKKNDLDPVLVWSLIRQESAFHSRAVSSSNALGLMQLIPPTAKEVAAALKLGNLEIPDDVFQTDRNISLGTRYLAQMTRQFGGSVPLALAAYNAGPGRMEIFLAARSEGRDKMIGAPQSPQDEMWIDELPWFETSFYVKAILRNTLLYRLLDQRQVQMNPDFWKSLVLSPSPTAKQ